MLQGAPLLKLLKMLFRLNRIYRVKLMQVRKTQVLPFKTLLLLLKLGCLLLGQAEVSYFKKHSIRVDKDVRRLDVAVDQARLVDVLKPLDQLLEKVEDHLAVWLVVFLVQKLPQRLPGTQLHLYHNIERYEIGFLVYKLVHGTL